MIAKIFGSHLGLQARPIRAQQRLCDRSTFQTPRPRVQVRRYVRQFHGTTGSTSARKFARRVHFRLPSHSAPPKASCIHRLPPEVAQCWPARGSSAHGLQAVSAMTTQCQRAGCATTPERRAAATQRIRRGAAPAKSAPAVLAHPLRVSSEPAACPPTDQLGTRRVPWPAPRPVFGDCGSVVQVP